MKTALIGGRVDLNGGRVDLSARNNHLKSQKNEKKGIPQKNLQYPSVFSVQIDGFHGRFLQRINHVDVNFVSDFCRAVAEQL